MWRGISAYRTSSRHWRIDFWTLRGHAYARSGRIAEAFQALATLQEMSKHQYVPALYRTFIYAGLNDADEAFNGLRKLTTIGLTT